MPAEWKPILDLANNVTVVAVVIYGMYLLVTGKLNTGKHTEDVAKGLEARITDLLGERDRAVEREEAARRELAANNEVLARLEATLRSALDALARRR